MKKRPVKHNTCTNEKHQAKSTIVHRSLAGLWRLASCGQECRHTTTRPEWQTLCFGIKHCKRQTLHKISTWALCWQLHRLQQQGDALSATNACCANCLLQLSSANTSHHTEEQFSSITDNNCDYLEAESPWDKTYSESCHQIPEQKTNSRRYRADQTLTSI